VQFHPESIGAQPRHFAGSKNGVDFGMEVLKEFRRGVERWYEDPKHRASWCSVIGEATGTGTEIEVKAQAQAQAQAQTQTQAQAQTQTQTQTKTKTQTQTKTKIETKVTIRKISSTSSPNSTTQQIFEGG